MKTITFSTACLKAISHLSIAMQNRIIADITRYKLTGEIPEKMSPMRHALFNSLILLLDSEAEESSATADSDMPDDYVNIAPKDSTAGADTIDSDAPKDNTVDPASPAPNYIAIDPSGHAVPLYIPNTASLPPDQPVCAFHG